VNERVKGESLTFVKGEGVRIFTLNYNRQIPRMFPAFVNYYYLPPFHHFNANPCTHFTVRFFSGVSRKPTNW